MTETYRAYEDLIQSYAYNEERNYSFLGSDSDFDQGVEILISQVKERTKAVIEYLK